MLAGSLLLFGVVGQRLECVEGRIGGEIGTLFDGESIVVERRVLDLALADPDTPQRVEHLAIATLGPGASAERVAVLAGFLRRRLAERAPEATSFCWRYAPLGPHRDAPGWSGGRADGALLIANNAVPGSEDEYHRWYDEVHLDETFATLGTVGAQRFEQVSDGGVDVSPYRFLVVYDVRAGEIAGAEQRRLALAADRRAAAARGEPARVPVPAAISGPRWAGWFAERRPSCGAFVGSS